MSGMLHPYIIHTAGMPEGTDKVGVTMLQCATKCNKRNILLQLFLPRLGSVLALCCKRRETWLTDMQGACIVVTMVTCFISNHFKFYVLWQSRITYLS